jgi:hypothetical protein
MTQPENPDADGKPQEKHWLDKLAVGLSACAFIASVAAAGFTGWQAATARYQLAVAQDTENRSLRAYIGISDHKIEDVSGSNPILRVVIKNFGLTTATNVQYWITSHLDDYPNPTHLTPEPFRPDISVMFPGSVDSPSFSFTKLEEMDTKGINDGTKPLYVYGAIKYTDAFLCHRVTEFRLMYMKPSLTEGRMAWAPAGNEVSESGDGCPENTNVYGTLPAR